MGGVSMLPILLTANFSISTEIVLGIVTVCFTAIEIFRAFKKDTSDDASNLTTIIVKLENIQASIKDIKTDINTMENESKLLGERVSKMEENLSSLWKYYESLHDDMKDFSHHQ